jgi:hypothetical protein
MSMMQKTPPGRRSLLGSGKETKEVVILMWFDCNRPAQAVAEPYDMSGCQSVKPS